MLQLPDHLRGLANADFAASGRAMHLLGVALATRGYDRESAFAFLTTAKGESGESWEERGLAILLLENQLLRLAADDIIEFDLILVGLGLKVEIGEAIPLKDSVLREGFSTLELRAFVTELVRKLRRRNRVHWPILQGECDQPECEYLLSAAREVSKLVLARYVYSVEDILREITRQLIVTSGVEDTFSRFGEQPAARWAQEPVDAPDFETEILRKLCADHRIYWVLERCGSELNSLVEYPLT
jgi:hypothetical protein